MQTLVPSRLVFTIPLVRRIWLSGVKRRLTHEPDDLARSELVASRLVRCFIETPDQVFKDQTHLVIGNGVGMQINVGKLRENQEEPVRFIQLGNLLLELEVLKDLTGLDEKLSM
jgi:hypothetical protein